MDNSYDRDQSRELGRDHTSSPDPIPSPVCGAGGDPHSTHRSPLPSWGSIAALCVCRLILPPLVVIYTILPAALHLRIIQKEDRLMQLVIAVESASSSAQVMIVSLNQLGLTEIASNMSYMYVFQYVSSIFSITLWVTLAMSSIYK
jgi:hypothetical protein